MRNKILLLLCMTTLLVSCRGPQLMKTGNREFVNMELSAEDRAMIDAALPDLTGNMDVVDYALDMTADKLQFSKRNDIPNGKANCVGYARYYATVCNYIFKAKGYDCDARPVVGYIDLNGTNLCNVLKETAPNEYKNFVKDHDFVQLIFGHDRAFIDPCLYDLIGNDFFDFESPFPPQ